MIFKLPKLVFLALLLCIYNSTISTAQNNSVLATGDWYKLAVEKEGVYKIDYSFIQGLGIDPGSINPNQIKIYGNGGKMLPQSNFAARPNDLIENAIWVEGASDNTFDANDYLLFYGQAPDSISYNNNTGTFNYSTNIFENKSYYFLTVSTSNGRRIETSVNQGLNFPVINSYDHIEVLQEEKTNILISGREWYGDRFDANNTHSYSFDIPNLKPQGKVTITSSVMAQSYEQSSFDILVNETKVGSQIIDAVSSYTYGLKGRNDVSTFDHQLSGNDLVIDLKYNYTDQPNSSFNSKGYLNYLLLQIECNLSQQEGSLNFRSIKSTEEPISTFNIANADANSVVWDISNPFQPTLQQTVLEGSNLKFGAVTVSLNEYILFNNTSIDSPEFIEQVSNQNLHSYTSANLLIVCHPEMLEEAERLAEFRRSHDGLEVVVATTTQVYNEFSSGSLDFTAIRDFARHLYSRQGLKHILLFGKGSYDYKNVYNKELNIVPIYESRNSLHPVETYSSDDYYGFLEENEGDWIESKIGDHTLDIGVGRLPVKTKEEATGVVDKIINYSNNKQLGKWKNKIVFVADDGDFNVHQKQAHQLAYFIDTAYSNFETKRLFLDNFKQESKPSGEVSPDAMNAINETINSGALIVNYTGHGGESGWTQEAILDVFMIDDWKNDKVLPLFVTATCEFGRHDDPRRDSGGEKTILNPNGGAIALVTTSRPVYSSTNFELNKAFYNTIFNKQNGIYLTLGEIFQATKNNSLNGSSNRNFSLLGDPSMRIAYPNYTISIDEINGKNTSLPYDTLKALSVGNLRGHISLDNNKVTNFTGKAFLTIYDKEITKNTLGNESEPFSYNEWSNVLYNGQVSVEDGTFATEFIIPKNINYNTGKGRISLYAIDELNNVDAHGANIEVPIGLSESNITDTTPPTIDLYINDTTFISGNITGENILLLARLSDKSGINTSSSNVTNNIIATLDDKTTFTLNEYYVASVDTYQSGWVAFPINNLEPGKHVITLTVSDTHNNITTDQIHFVVSNNGSLIIQDLGNYPNPANQFTNFYVTHNRSGEDIQVEFKLLKISGKLIATQVQEFINSNSTLKLYQWNSNEINLSQGIYIYSVKMRSMLDGAENQRFQKFIKVN